MSIRPSIMVAAGAAAAVLWLASAAVPATAAPGDQTCRFQGSASITPPLTNTSQNFVNTFQGSLSSCQSDRAGAPTSGTMSAGGQVALTVTCTNTSTGQTSPCTVLYQLPVPSGSGSCSSNSSVGDALVSWSSGTRTVVDYTTTGVLGVLVLEGRVATSLTVALVPSSVPAGYSAPATYTIVSDEPAVPPSDSVLGVFSFDTGLSCVTNGVSGGSLDGAITFG